MSPNPHTAYYALLVLESVVKNCGSPIHDEIATRENCEAFSQLIEQTPHENVKAKMLELIQAWAFAFRSNDKYTAIKVSISSETNCAVSFHSNCGWVESNQLIKTILFPPGLGYNDYFESER